MVQSPPWHNMIAGSTAGLISCILFYPLESTEARMQVARKKSVSASKKSDDDIGDQNVDIERENLKSSEEEHHVTTTAVVPGKEQLSTTDQYPSFFATFKHTYRTEGLRGLYKGVAPTALGAMWNSACYFSMYEYFKSVIHAKGWWSLPSESIESLSGQQHIDLAHHIVHYSTVEMIVAASIAGFICTFLVNPFYTLKMRMLTQVADTGDGGSSGSGSRGKNSSMIRTLRHMIRTEGVLSLWKGVLPSLVGVSEGAIQLAVFENCTHWLGVLLAGNLVLGAPSVVHFASGVISRAVSTLLTYPYQVLRARLMAANSHYTGLVDCVRKTRSEGYRAFYQGLIPNLTRQLTPAGIFFLVYNLVKKLLAQLSS